MAGPVGHESDEVPARFSVCLWLALVKRVADRLDHRKVGALLITAEIIALAMLPGGEIRSSSRA